VARHSRSLRSGSVMVSVIAIVGYALLCGVLYLK
jgi:hypothetical protein